MGNTFSRLFFIHDTMNLVLNVGSFYTWPPLRRIGLCWRATRAPYVVPRHEVRGLGIVLAPGRFNSMLRLAKRKTHFFSSFKGVTHMRFSLKIPKH
jgi:hypothetical protein